jgi:hypothetical protein
MSQILKIYFIYFATLKSDLHIIIYFMLLNLGCKHISRQHNSFKRVNIFARKVRVPRNNATPARGTRHRRSAQTSALASEPRRERGYTIELRESEFAPLIPGAEVA